MRRQPITLTDMNTAAMMSPDQGKNMEIKVGDWVWSQWSGHVFEMRRERTPSHHALFVDPVWGSSFTVGPSGSMDGLTPCDPPPLHKALRGLVEARRVTGPSSHEMSSQFVAAAIKVAELYENGER